MIKNLLMFAGLMMGGASILTAGACFIQHFAAGDLFGGAVAGADGQMHDALKECLALGTAGVAMFSPGMQALKVGVFSRAASPPTSPPGGPPTVSQVAANEAASPKV